MGKWEMSDFVWVVLSKNHSKQNCQQSYVHQLLGFLEQGTPSTSWAVLGMADKSEAPDSLMAWCIENKLTRIEPGLRTCGFTNPSEFLQLTEQDIVEVITTCEMNLGEKARLKRGMIHLKEQQAPERGSTQEIPPQLLIFAKPDGPLYQPNETVYEVLLRWPYYRQAASFGDPQAQNHLGMTYLLSSHWLQD